MTRRTHTTELGFIAWDDLSELGTGKEVWLSVVDGDHWLSNYLPITTLHPASPISRLKRNSSRGPHLQDLLLHLRSVNEQYYAHLLPLQSQLRPQIKPPEAPPVPPNPTNWQPARPKMKLWPLWCKTVEEAIQINEIFKSLYGEKAMMLPERTNKMTGVYAKQCMELAKELGLPSINLWAKMQETESWQKKFLSDGLHLIRDGNAVVHQELVKVFSEAWHSAPDMPYDFPHHLVIDGNNPEKAFLHQQCPEKAFMKS